MKFYIKKACLKIFIFILSIFYNGVQFETVSSLGPPSPTIVNAVSKSNSTQQMQQKLGGSLKNKKTTNLTGPEEKATNNDQAINELKEEAKRLVHSLHEQFKISKHEQTTKTRLQKKHVRFIANYQWWDEYRL